MESTVPTISDYLNLSAASYTTGGTPVAPAGWSVMTDGNGVSLTQAIANSGMQAVAFQNNTTGAIVIQSTQVKTFQQFF